MGYLKKGEMLTEGGKIGGYLISRTNIMGYLKKGAMFTEGGEIGGYQLVYKTALVARQNSSQKKKSSRNSKAHGLDATV